MFDFRRVLFTEEKTTSVSYALDQGPHTTIIFVYFPYINEFLLILIKFSLYLSLSLFNTPCSMSLVQTFFFLVKRDEKNGFLHDAEVQLVLVPPIQQFLTLF